MKNRRDKRFEILALLLPVLLLLGTGLFSMRREHLEAEKFQLAVEKIGIENLPRTRQGKQAVKFSIYIGQQGKRPQWWGQGIDVRLGEISYKATKLPVSWKGPKSWTVPAIHERSTYDSNSHQYIVTFHREGNGCQMYAFKGNLEAELFFDEKSTHTELASVKFKRAFDFRK